MSHYKSFEYQFDDDTSTTAWAVVAAHDIGAGVLIEFVSPKDLTTRKVRFVADTRVPKSLALASTLNSDELIEFAIKKFLGGRWGDRLAPVNVAPDVIHIEPIVSE